jgi:Uma2 family endonuclease
MSVLKEKVKFTYEDYLCLPDNGKRYQVIEGELYMVPAPTPNHQDILLKLGILLREFVEEHKLGKVYCAPCDVILSPEDIVQPDIFFISSERQHIITERNIQGAPDLVAEILSPTTAKLDKTLKTRLYERFGVKEYWLVDPEEKRIAVYESKGAKFGLAQEVKQEGKVSSKVLPRFEVEVKDIF